jgi:hypothetical protein
MERVKLIMKQCKKCEIAMDLIQFGEEIGAMGIPYHHEYYECPHCSRTETSYNGAANDLAQHIDKKILNNILKAL